jgi:hypothetical protein
MEEPTLQKQNWLKPCPGCGAQERLYRTPRGLRCADCVRKMDSGGLTFR